MFQFKGLRLGHQSFDAEFYIQGHSGSGSLRP